MVTRWNYPSVSRFTLGRRKQGLVYFNTQHSSRVSATNTKRFAGRERALINGRSLSLCSLSDYRTRGPAMTDTTRQAARERLWFGGQ
jgi:hypothetical protein